MPAGAARARHGLYLPCHGRVGLVSKPYLQRKAPASLPVWKAGKPLGIAKPGLDATRGSSALSAMKMNHFDVFWLRCHVSAQEHPRSSRSGAGPYTLLTPEMPSQAKGGSLPVPWHLAAGK